MPPIMRRNTNNTVINTYIMSMSLEYPTQRLLRAFAIKQSSPNRQSLFNPRCLLPETILLRGQRLVNL